MLIHVSRRGIDDRIYLHVVAGADVFGTHPDHCEAKVAQHREKQTFLVTRKKILLSILFDNKCCFRCLVVLLPGWPVWLVM